MDDDVTEIERRVEKMKIELAIEQAMLDKARCIRRIEALEKDIERNKARLRDIVRHERNRR